MSILSAGNDFRTMLARRQININSLVCVGLDPLLSKMPVPLKRMSASNNEWQEVVIWMIDIVNATAPFASMYKLQRAHYESIKNGEKALRAIVNHIHTHYPDIPVFLDCKRGDIGRTQARYMEAHFGLDGVDGMNFSPYMGKDCMEYLVTGSKLEAIVGLCYTSNPDAREIQDLELSEGQTTKLGLKGGRAMLWEAVALKIMQWGQSLGVNRNTGLVMAAAYKPKDSDDVYSWHLKRVREIVGNSVWFLEPGLGTQKGYEFETVENSYVGPGSIAPSSSSNVIFASMADDYAKASAGQAETFRDNLREASGRIAA